MAEESVAYTKDLASKLAEAAAVVAKPVASAAGEVKPLQYYSNYRFSDPKEAVRFMQSKDFTGFWDKNNAGKKNIGIRAELNDARRYNSAKPKITYSQSMANNEASLARLKAKDLARVAKFGGTPSPDSVYQSAAKYNAVKERSIGRFYTDLFANNSVEDISHYLNPANSNVESQSYPIRVIADKRYGNFSLAGRKPYDGLIDLGAGSHEQRMFARRNLDLTRKTGVDLGAALSSNTRSESFVPSSLARPASEGGAMRVAGRVNSADGVITVAGKPRIGVAQQTLKNVLPYMGQSMAKASPYLGVVGTGVMAYQGYKDYNSDNMMTREYGNTDPFGLRPQYDLAINILSGSQSIPQAWETQRRLVEDPEWQMRNPLSASLYNMQHGNFEPLKAFVGGYIPEFLK
jgi:hypothetical protein